MSLVGDALLYARTASHLRPSQVVWRPLRWLQRRLDPPAAPPVGVLLGSPTALASAVASWPVEAGVVCRANDVLEGRFEFLNREERLSLVDWGRRHRSHLWNYHLHYFDYAVHLAWAWRATRDPQYARGFEALALGWAEGTEPGRGDGWEPYALALRTVNWIKAMLLFGEALDSGVRAALESSLARQLAFLERRLEWHVLANHLQKDLKALVVGGLYFDGPAADRWLRKGEKGLWRELFEQVLPDGTQYERSPMYHAIATADWLEVMSLLRAAGRPVPEEAVDRVKRMVDAFGILSRTDGSLHLLNDAANGPAPGRARLDHLARTVLGTGVPDVRGLMALPEAGYWGWSGPSGQSRLLVDAGEPGPAYQPGHAHCDLLSFELDLAGRPFAVDAGVHGYDGDPFREYVRSTRAHNTVMIDGKEQAEVWATFRMARRPRVAGGRSIVDGGQFRFEGSYWPYHDRRARHRRHIEGSGASWRLTDRVDGAHGARLDSFLHLHPDWTVERQEKRLVARAGGVAVAIELFGIDGLRVLTGSMDPVQGWHCPEFGRALAAPALEMTVNENDGREFGYTIEVLETDDG